MGKQMVTFDQSRWKHSGDAFYGWEAARLASAVEANPLSVDTILRFYKTDVRDVTFGPGRTYFELVPQDAGSDNGRHRSGFYDLTIPPGLPKANKAFVLIEACAHGFYRVTPSQDPGVIEATCERLLESDRSIPDRLLERIEICTPGQPALFSQDLPCYDMNAPCVRRARNGFGLIVGNCKDARSQGLDSYRLQVVKSRR